MVKEVQNHKKSTTNGLHGETSTSVSNKNIQVMSPSEMKNSVSRITKTVFQLFLYKVKSHVCYFPKYFTKFMYLINVLFFFKSG